MPLPATNSGIASYVIKDVGGKQKVIKMIQPTAGEAVMATIPTSGVPVSTMQTVRTVAPTSTQARIIGTTSPQIVRTTLQAFQSPRPGTGQLVAITVPSSNVGRVASSPRADPAILPKIQISSSHQVVFNAGQRIINQSATSTQNTTPKHFISPILDHSGSRKRQDVDCDYTLESKRRKAEKVGKGLRHFSMKVCEKVQKKGTTSYNEVADELVAEFTSSAMAITTADQQYDQKNIRRRVYDALNVLMAMNIISKEKKEIKWLGLPANSLQECQNLEKEKLKRLERLRTKSQKVQDLILQQVAFKSLVERNRHYEKVVGTPVTNSLIVLPFIVVTTSKETVIDCSISKDKMEYLFNFDNTFKIHDDIEVLKQMGLSLGLEDGQSSAEQLERARSMVPKSLEKYVEQLASGEKDTRFDAIATTVSGEDDLAATSTLNVGSPSSSEFSEMDNESEMSDVEVN